MIHRCKNMLFSFPLSIKRGKERKLRPIPIQNMAITTAKYHVPLVLYTCNSTSKLPYSLIRKRPTLHACQIKKLHIYYIVSTTLKPNQSSKFATSYTSWSFIRRKFYLHHEGNEITSRGNFNYIGKENTRIHTADYQHILSCTNILYRKTNSRRLWTLCQSTTIFWGISFSKYENRRILLHNNGITSCIRNIYNAHLSRKPIGATATSFF